MYHFLCITCIYTFSSNIKKTEAILYKISHFNNESLKEVNQKYITWKVNLEKANNSAKSETWLSFIECNNITENRG